jgi:hypothetical protein
MSEPTPESEAQREEFDGFMRNLGDRLGTPERKEPPDPHVGDQGAGGGRASSLERHNSLSL